MKQTFKDKVKFEKSTITSRYSNDLEDAIKVENYELAQALKELNDSGEIPPLDFDNKGLSFAKKVLLGTPPPKISDKYSVEFSYSEIPPAIIEPSTSIPILSNVSKIPLKLKEFLKKENALNNFICAIGNDIDRLKSSNEILYISGFFDWCASAYGSDYWNDLHDKWVQTLK